MTTLRFGKEISIEDELLRPYYHLREVKSHPLLSETIMDAFQYWLKIPEDKLRLVKEFMDIFANCNYMFDDIQDNTLYRRTAPAAHVVFGVPLCVTTFMHMMGLCAEKVIEMNHPQAMKIFITEYLGVMRGQGLDIYWRDNLILCPSEEELVRNVENKGSSIFLLPLRLMQLFSNNKTDYTRLVTLFGVYYNMKDDYFNLMKPHELDGKSRGHELTHLRETQFCEDLTDGKLSWPVCHALRQGPEANILVYMLKQHTRDMGMKLYFLQLLEKFGSIDYLRGLLDKYDKDMRDELVRHGGNPVFEGILNNFKGWKKSEAIKV